VLQCGLITALVRGGAAKRPESTSTGEAEPHRTAGDAAT
jgi:hypothetical protein